jgi:glycosyltransferase 2 family protein
MAMSARLLTPVAFWLGLVAALLVLWWSGQAGRAWQQTRDARLAPLALVLALGMALPWIHAQRWVALLRGVGTDLPARQATGFTISAALVNYASPGFLGAPAKAVLANQGADVPYRRSAVTMAVEQGLDFLVLLLGSAVALLIVGPALLGDLRPADGVSPLVIAAGIGLCIAAVVLLALARRRALALGRRVLGAFRELGRNVDRPLVAALTLLYWLTQAAVVALLLWALRLPLRGTSVLALATLPLLAGQLAPLPGGLGAREAVSVALAGATGIGAVALLGLAVLQRVLLVAALPLALGATRLSGARQ